MTLEDDISLTQFNYALTTELHKIIISQGGLIMHASASLVDNEVMIFTGPSGAGKSTIVKLLKGYAQPFADDGVILIKKNNQFYCYQSSYFDSNKGVVNTYEGFKVRGVFFLKKSNKNKIIKIAQNNLLLQILSPQILTVRDIRINQFISLTKFIEYTNFYNLYFIKKRNKLIKYLVNFEAQSK